MGRPPPDFWHTAPCGCPQEPWAWLTEDGPVCHCGVLLNGTSHLMLDLSGATEVQPCSGCGCMVAIPDTNEKRGPDA